MFSTQTQDRLKGTISWLIVIITSGVFIFTSGVFIFAPFGRQSALAEQNSYCPVTGPCNLNFPKDHGIHPGYRTEWWYYTGNLQDENGYRYGFQLTFFRHQTSPPGSDSMWPHPTSGWRSQQIFLAHAALTDLHNRRFYTAEDIGRGFPELAGVDQHSDCIRIFLKNWSVSISPFGHALNTRTDDFSFHLNTEPLKAPVLHGNAGYSRKGISPESASCYYSYTRLKTEGTLEIGGKTLTVSGESWMDHEFSSAPLESDLAGWDWFSLQFDDGSELMLYFLRHKDGSYSPASSGTFVTPTGESAHLVAGDIGIEVLQNWKSPRSGAVYPSRWRLMVKNLGIDVQITTNLEDQEVETPGSTRVTYWEGSVSGRGTKHNQPISGHGYVELTGYARPFDAPM